jgi:WD40 repeat protein
MSTKARLQSTCMVAFSPDGRLQASDSWDGAMRRWDVGNHQVLATLRGHEKTAESVGFSIDGKILASASYPRDHFLPRSFQPSEIETP